MRLSAFGQLYTCLFATTGLDLRTPLRQGASDEELRAILHESWKQRSDRYSEERGQITRDQRNQRDQKVGMSHIGG